MTMRDRQNIGSANRLFGISVIKLSRIDLDIATSNNLI